MMVHGKLKRKYEYIIETKRKESGKKRMKAKKGDKKRNSKPAVVAKGTYSLL